VAELAHTLLELLQNLGTLLVQVIQLALTWALLIAWVAWWLLGVNWKKTWPVLARGGWAPVVLLGVMAALVWSRLAPGDRNFLGFVHVANFWWQLYAVSLVIALTLFCGWLQGVFGWTPPEIDFEPPPPADHGHEHH